MFLFTTLSHKKKCYPAQSRIVQGRAVGVAHYLLDRPPIWGIMADNG